MSRTSWVEENEMKPEMPMSAQAVSNHDISGLEPLPSLMEGRPFGFDEAGRPLNRTKGVIIRTTVEYMLECVGQRAAESLPSEMPDQERTTHLAQAKAAALNQLVERLNRIIPDPRYHVTSAYLLSEGNRYSVEFDAFLGEICREISGDPKFHFNRGAKSIPNSILSLARPFSLSQVYRLLPRFAAKFAAVDFRVIRVTSTSADIQWHLRNELELLPAALHRRFLYISCQYIQGALASIPQVLCGLPMASIKEIWCLLKGDVCCEWECTWQNPRPRTVRVVWGGLVVSGALLAYALLRLPGWAWLSIVALLPAAGGWFISRLRRLAYEREQRERMLLEQRERHEEQYDALEQAHANLQLSTVTLQQKISELTALHEIGMALSATLDLDELLDTSLRAVTMHLGFDRAMIMLVDEERRVLTRGRGVGGTPEMAVLVGQLEVSLDDSDSFLTQIVRSKRPLLVSNVNQVANEGDQKYLSALRTPAFMAVPLITKGKTVGVLLVDNAVTGRSLPDNVEDLLFTVGAQIASAVDSARLYQTLEQAVEERTAELVDRTREAQEARAVAEAASRAKSAFLANMSHELRTPLNAIIGYSEMLMEDARERGRPGSVSDLEKIHASGEHLLGIINDILDFSEIEAEKTELHLETFDVSDMSEDVVHTIEPLVLKNANTLKVDCADDLGTMHADPAKVRQSLLNLLSNACKFTERGDIALRVVRESVDGLEWVKFTVSDTGIGLAPEQMGELFRPFSQAESSLTRKYGGTGLGLVISKRFCQMMGGDITVESGCGKGSTFTMWLPVRVSEN